MLFEIHYSKDATYGKDVKNEKIREMFNDVWKYKKVEAATKEDAIEKLYEGDEQINYVLSVTPILT